VDNGRIQLFDERGAYRTWIPETGQVEEGQVWSPEPLPDLGWEPIDLRCASGFCVALDVDIQGRRFTPVDRETGEAGPKWPVALPGSDKGVWDLSSDGRVAMIISGGVQVIAADGATVTPVGVGELGEVMDLKWAPDGGLWIVGMVGGGSTIVHWTSDETQVIRKVDGIAHTPLVAPDGERAAVRIVDVGGMELSLFEGSDAP
jgi:hypothetical protein